MAEFKIQDSDFAPLKDKVVIVTGGSSGIGLATVKLLLSVGAHVVAGDLNPPSTEDANLTFHKTDVTSWPNLLSLFETAISKHGHIDHVFANAGIGPSTDYFASNFSPIGELLEPVSQCLEINLRGAVNTAYLALHHFRTQKSSSATEGQQKCSLVITASASAFQRFSPVDYTTSKHAVLGFMRSVYATLLQNKLPIRINAIAPSWTLTGMVNQQVADELSKAGGVVQGPEAVARNVALLFADEKRNGELSYSADGRFWEIDHAVLVPAGQDIVSAGEKGVLEEALVGARAERTRDDAKKVGTTS